MKLGLYMVCIFHKNIGVIEARQRLQTKQKFGLDELGFLKLFSKITSIALKNSRDISKPLSFVNKLRSCFDTGINISKCTSISHLNETFKNEISRLIGSQYTRLYIFKEDKLYSNNIQVPYSGENNSLLQLSLNLKLIQIFKESKNHRNFNCNQLNNQQYMLT